MTDISNDFAKKVLVLLDQGAVGSLSPAELSAALKDIGWGQDSLLNAAVHALHHFAADEDIRNKDGEYDRLQRLGLRKIAEEVRSTLTKDSSDQP